MVHRSSYVLVTAAYNESKFIGAAIRSVLAQTHRPMQWVIVSDGSTDRTDSIVGEFAIQHPFIRLFRITEDHPRNFKAQVHAINAGVAQLREGIFEFIGNMDADVTLPSDYFERLLQKLAMNPKLGIGGGFVYDKCGDGKFRNRRGNRVTSVAHAVQMFRRECFEAVGAYVPLPYGGPDSHAETSARMRGWQVESFPELIAFHHRPTGSAGGLLRGHLRQGKMDYSLGYLPLFEVLKLLSRLFYKPWVLGSVTRMIGFASCYCTNEKREVSSEFVAFLRTEQRQKLSDFFWIFRRSWPLVFRTDDERTVERNP